MPKRYRKYNLNEDLDDLSSEKQSYFLGYFVADGNLRDTTVRITSGDKQVLEDLKTCLNSDHPITERKKKNCFYINFNSKKLSDNLKNIGYSSDKCRDLVYPEEVSDRDFIRGFFDGDGGIYESKGYMNTRFFSEDKNFLKQIRKKLNQKAGCTSVNIHERTNNGFVLSYMQKDSKKIQDFFYPANYYLKRKKRKYEELQQN